MDEQRLFLLDGMALVYRAHFAFAVKPIMTSYGLNASAVLGFVNTLVELLQKENPTHLAVVFDTAAPTARHERFPAYKAQREAMPEDLSIAIPHVKRLIDAFQIPVLERDGYEADDIIGTLAKQAEAEGGYVTYMVTPDKDFAQLVDERTFIWKPGRQGNEREILGVAQVRENWGIERPEQVIDVLGLWGDAVDNIPGIPGFGEKTAKALIAAWGSVEGVIANVDKLKGKQKEKVQEHAEQARLSRELAVIQIDVPMDLPIEALRRKAMDEDAVKGLLVEFEFNALGRRLFGDGFKAGRGFHRRPENTAAETGEDESGQLPLAVMQTLATIEKKYVIADTPKSRAEAVARVLKAGGAGLDVDRDSGDARAAHLRGIAFAFGGHEAVYLTGAAPSVLAAEVAPVFADAAATVTGHDLKEQIQVLILAGVAVRCRVFDTMLAQLLAEPEQKASLGYLAEAHLGYTLGGAAKTEAGGQLLMAGLDEDHTAVGESAMERADTALRLAPVLQPAVERTEQTRVFTEIECPLVPVIAGMEAAGIKLESAVLREASVRLEKDIRHLELSVFEKAGGSFNLNSPKQLGEILFDKLRLIEKPKKTKTGQYMTGEDVLAELAGEHQIVADLLAYREASKLKSTYVDALPGAISPRTGRVHTTFHQLHAATGRLASNNPNLQNIPIRTEQGRAIRKAFISAGPDWSLLSADYSQVELRVMASLSGDAHMIAAFQEGLDIHTATAARVHGVPLAETTPDMRRVAKMVNFGIIYGISAFGLAQRLGIPRADASRFIDEYFLQYPGVKNFMESTVEDAKKKGYVETVTGRRRYLRDINSGNMNVRKAAERTAINTPIQGSAADMIKIAMVRVADFLAAGNHATRMLLQVHDELVFEVPSAELDLMRAKLPEIMRDALPLAVPVVVETGEGKDWFEAHA